MTVNNTDDNNKTVSRVQQALIVLSDVMSHCNAETDSDDCLKEYIYKKTKKQKKKA